MAKPIYEHDCLDCTFLGRFRRHDLYYCDQGHFPTVIARFGNKPWEYHSGLSLVRLNPILAETLRRARKKGLPDHPPPQPPTSPGQVGSRVDHRQRGSGKWQIWARGSLG